MLASIFVVAGVKALSRPTASQLTAARRVSPLLERADPRLPRDPAVLVRVKAASDVVAGLALATGRFTRPAAAVLAAGLVPTTVAGHPFWSAPPEARAEQRIHFLKNIGLLGGLLLAAVDTEGRPDLRYRAGHAADRSRRSVRRAVRTARREARIAAVSAATARRIPG